jgi:2-polyprenyl-6-methoxyphenol hydroxylase-like FAD-dependent oxidoreductase
LWKKRHPIDVVTVFEQNPKNATFGFGVVFSDRAMDFLHAGDPQIADEITARMETWSNITLVNKGQKVEIDGVGFSAIGRLELLLLIQKKAREVGVELNYDTRLNSVDDIPASDVIVAADGVNSMIRRTFEGDFLTSTSYLDEKFVWFGTTKVFDTLTQTFVTSKYGTFNAHHYRYSPTMSTFIVECDRKSWLRAGFDSLSPEESRHRCQEIFAETLDGHELVANKSLWRNFPWIWNDRWSFNNMVLIGDALRTAHYSIGSGTRLALEDAITLADALDAEENLGAAFRLFEAKRRPIVEKLVRASKSSTDWYADFPAHMQLHPLDMAYSYITRSSRVDNDRLRQMSPKFMARYEKERPQAAE